MNFISFGGEIWLFYDLVDAVEKNVKKFRALIISI